MTDRPEPHDGQPTSDTPEVDNRGARRGYFADRVNRDAPVHDLRAEQLKEERDEAEKRAERWHAANMRQLVMIRELRAEVERLQETLKWTQETDQRHAETILTLRAEVERLTHRAAYAERVWKELGTSREQLQAEVERLRALHAAHCGVSPCQDAEVERLRKKLVSDKE